ncbi:MAG: hypothetical protein M5U17_08750 [Ignavibacterium sp.]|nr:hypothetical protein [Ignavibacterium sp.]
MSSLDNAQIKIKERVEINPEASTQLYYPAATFEPCGAHPVVSNQQYVYSCSGFPVEPYQQLFPYQSSSGLQFSAGSNYEIEITEGIDYAYMERIAYSDSLGNFYEAEYLGSLITGLPGYLLSGTGKYQGWQPTGTFLREKSTNYYIHFDNYSLQQTSVTVRITNLNTQETTYWKTVIVNPQLQIVNQQYENDTLLHYYSKDVSLQLYNINSAGCQHPGYGGCPPDNIRFNIEIIEGQQYGNIKNGLTGDFSTSFTGLPYNELYTFTYYANGLQPEDSAVVRIRHSSNDAEITPIEFSFVVKRNTIPPPSEGGSIYVKMDKDVVIPGDTVNVQLRLIDEIGDTVDFLAMQSFSVDLAEGAEYGTILDIITADTSDSFADIGNMFKIIIEDQITPQQAQIIVVAQTDLMLWSRPVSINSKTEEKEKEHTADIVNNGGGTTPDVIIIGDHLVGVGEITITKSPIIVEILPSVINAGDTAQIIPKQLNSDGTTTAFDRQQSFEIGMLEGCEAGQILFGDELAPYFNNITQPIYFVADSNLTGTDTVKIRVGLIEGIASKLFKTNSREKETLVVNKNKTTQQKPLKENTTAYCFIGEIERDYMGDGTVVVGNESIEILLGETKYFAVKKKEVNGVVEKIEIVEIETDYGGEPDFPASAGEGWVWMKQSDVWPTEPAIKVEGEKIGVYWEKEKPVWNGNTKKRNLKEGIIRLVGRYWEEGKTYKVKLTARTTNGDQASIEIEVKRPNILGDINNIVKDVFSNDINIDNLCIINGGKLGLPPQIVKGHMEKETTFRNSFRYEPRLDISVQNNISDRKKYLEDFTYYTVTANSMGSIPMPNNHNNVRPVPYVTSPIKISNYLFDNIDNYIRRARKNKEGKWLAPFFVGYEKGKPTTMLVQYYNYALNELNKDRSQAMDFAIAEIKKWLLTEQFIDGKKYAQTRIFSSYGMLQQVFYFACDDKIASYSIDNEMQKPESLNEFDYVFNAYRYKMGKKLSSKPWNQWRLGFEEELISFLQSYNPGENYYGLKVFNFSFQYLPKK